MAKKKEHWEERRRHFDKDVEIAKHTTAIMMAQAAYIFRITVAISILAISASLLAIPGLSNLVPLRRLLFSYCGVVLIVAGILCLSYNRYSKKLGDSSDWLDNIPGVAKAGAVWIVYDRKDEPDYYDYELDSQERFAELDNQGKPVIPPKKEEHFGFWKKLLSVLSLTHR